MSVNADIAHIFYQMADALELLGANRFRVNAYQRGARTLENMTEDITSVAAAADEPVKRLAELDGIGKGLAEKIVEYLDGGTVEEHRELLEKVPEGLFQVLEIPGLGPKAVKLMWERLGITSVEDLKTRLDTGELAELPRMGAKTVENIRQAIAFQEKAGDRTPIGIARPIALDLLEELRSVDQVHRADFAGSLRRGRETIGDLDFLVACDDPEVVRERFCGHPAVTQVLARGETKCSVRLSVHGVALQADLRLVDEAVYGAALLYFTGSKDHNVRLREIAGKKNLHLNEYGLFEGTEERPQERGQEPLAAGDEDKIYEALGLPYFPPELREDRWEFSDSGRQRAGELICLQDVKAELHSHTTASDGKLSIEAMAEHAKARGFHTLAITDHSVTSAVANGLDADGLRRHMAAIREANEKIDGITLLAGSEVDIHADGHLDYDDELLAELDVVVASPHVALRQSPEAATERLLAAIRHPLVHILGHPTGRIINKREGLSPDMGALFEAAAKHDTALEVNANWHRLDLRDTHLHSALEHGCRIAIDTDAHHDAHFDFLVYGVLTARRAGLRAADCINTWSAEQLHSWLRSKR